MLKLLMLPVTILVASAKMTIGVIKWILGYRIGKVLIGCSLVTAGLQKYGLQLSLVDESLIIMLVGLIAVVVLVGPRIRSWWITRRQKHAEDEKRRKAERENQI